MRIAIRVIFILVLIGGAVLAQETGNPLGKPPQDVPNPLGKPPAEAGNPLGRPAGTPTLTELLGFGHGLPLAIIDAARDSRQQLLEAVYEASRQAQATSGGVPRIYGTLATAFGGRLVYTPTPEDRLVVKTGGETHEFVVKKGEGNPRAESADDWLESNHDLVYTHRLGEEIAVEISEQTVGERFTIRVRGKATHRESKILFDLDLTATGTYYFQRDLSGYEMKSDYDIKGTMSGKGVEIAADEHHYFMLIVAQRRGAVAGTTSGNSTAATHSVSQLRNIVKLGPDTYRWVDAKIVKTFKYGLPSWPYTQWKSEGFLLRNDRKWGEYGISVERSFAPRKKRLQFTIQTFVTTPDERIELERYNYFP